MILAVEKLSLLRGVGAKATVRRGVSGTLFEKLISGRDGSEVKHATSAAVLYCLLKVES